MSVFTIQDDVHLLLNKKAGASVPRRICTTTCVLRYWPPPPTFRAFRSVVPDTTRAPPRRLVPLAAPVRARAAAPPTPPHGPPRRVRTRIWERPRPRPLGATRGTWTQSGRVHLGTRLTAPPRCSCAPVVGRTPTGGCVGALRASPASALASLRRWRHRASDFACSADCTLSAVWYWRDRACRRACPAILEVGVSLPEARERRVD